MNFTFEVNTNGWEGDSAFWDNIKVVAQDAMAIRLSDIVLQNFGTEGIDRPTEWPQLHPVYAATHHDGDRTPTLVLSGELRSSIDVELGKPEYASVFTNCPYAAAHQYGESENPDQNLPARPFFPITEDGELTEYAQAQLVEAAEQALARELA